MKFRKEFEKIINSLQIEKLNEKSLRKIKKRLDYLDNYINKQEYSTCKMLESPVSEIFFNPIFEKEDFFIN
jgi:hypothetical protein